MQVQDKQAYETPDLEELGSVEDLTLGQSTGWALDADFSAGTPAGDLTFS